MTEPAYALQALQTAAKTNGFDAMPTLIRVATDLFVGRTAPSIEEVARFEELMLGLLEVADLATRAIVARKLAPCPHAPGAVLARLLVDDMEVASSILALSPRVPRDALFSLAADDSPAAAAAIARREDLEPELVRMLAHNSAPAVTDILAENPYIELDSDIAAHLVAKAATRPALAERLLRRGDIDPADLAPLYLLADDEDRRAIRESLDRQSGAGRRAEQTPRIPDAGDTAVLEAVSESGRAALVGEAIASAFGISLDQAARLVEEPSGEPLALALHAAGLSREAIGRVLLLTTPAIAISVPKFFGLIEICEQISRQGALRLTAALSRTKGAQPPHQPYLHSTSGVERGGSQQTATVRPPAPLLIQRAG